MTPIPLIAELRRRVQHRIKIGFYGDTDHDTLALLTLTERLWEEVQAWRTWNDRDPHEPDNGIMLIEDTRAATDAALAALEKTR